MLFAFTGAFGQEGFVENLGQWPDHVDYKLNIPGGQLWCEEEGLTFQLIDPIIHKFLHPTDVKSKPPAVLDTHVYKLHFEDADMGNGSGEEQSQAYYNYFLGADESRWASKAFSYSKLRYQDIYPNIDLKVYTKTNSLKYDFIVHPGGQPDDIVQRYEGQYSLSKDGESLVIELSVGNVVELAPYAYQFIDGKLIDVACHFKLKKNKLSFDLGDYNPDYKLIIDPEISFASYIGTTASNFGFTATNDSEGNLIAGAAVFAADYPVTGGAVQVDFNSAIGSYCDAAISKFGSDGTTLIYSTYLGGSGLEMPHSLIADSDDNWIVMGTTGSSDFPTTAGAYQSGFVGGDIFSFASFFIPSSHQNGCDFFVSKFSADGSGLDASTFVGEYGTDGLNMGNELFYNYGDSFRGEVIVDENDNIIVASTTQSPVFPTTPGAPQPNFGGGLSDGVLFKLNPSLTNMEFATYFGGSDDDSGYSVQIDSQGNLVMCGGTRSTNLPTTAGAHEEDKVGGLDGFIVKYNGGGTILDCTYVGTTSYDQCYFTQIDDEDFIYVIGQSTGTNTAIGDVYSNPGSGQFITKYSSDLSMIEWRTTIGTGNGTIDVSPTAFLVSDCKQVYFSGWGGLTNSNNAPYANSSTTSGLPVTPDAYQGSTDGSDFYLCVLAPQASDLVYATFLGGGTSNEHVDGGTSKFDKDGLVYQAVCAGCGGNDDFPTTPGAWSADNGSTNCNLGVFKFDLGAIQAFIDIDGPDLMCQGGSAQFINNSLGGTDYAWNFGDGGESTEFEPNYTFDTPGVWQVSLIVTDNTGCLLSDDTFIEVEVIPAVNPSIAPVDPLCPGESVELDGAATADLYWLDDPTLSATDVANPVVSPTETTTYYLVDTNECGTDTAQVTVEVVWVNTSVSPDQSICIGDEVEISAFGGAEFFWEPPTGLDNPNIQSPTASPDESTTYYVTITTLEECEVIDSVYVNVDQNPPGGNTYPDIGLCTGHDVELEASPGLSWNWFPPTNLDDPTIQNPTANPLDSITYFVTITNSCGEGTDQVTVNVIVPQAFAGNDGEVCLGQWHPVWADGGVEYLWTPPQYAANADEANTSVSPPESMEMVVYVTDEYGCVATDEVYVNVLPLPEVDAGPHRAINWMDDVHLFGYATGIDFWWTPDLWIECTDCLEPLIYPEESMYYYLHTIDDNGCIGVDSTLVELFFPIYIPNTFTPDNDGRNDVFQAYGDNIRGFRMEIYDRWGQMVFESDDINKPWTGGFRDGDHYVQIDTYVWVVWYDALEGRKKLVGHVNVIR